LRLAQRFTSLPVKQAVISPSALSLMYPPDEIPAIALTALARSEDRTRALRAGFLVHVAKPVEPSELVATVASITGRTVDGEE
jgi:CheY-like chemotaxis protein